MTEMKRKAPSKSASEYMVGAMRVGLDGCRWTVHKTKAGQRWVRNQKLRKASGARVPEKWEWKAWEAEFPRLKQLRWSIRVAIQACGPAFVIVPNPQRAGKYGDPKRRAGADLLSYPYLLGELR